MKWVGQATQTEEGELVKIGWEMDEVGGAGKTDGGRWTSEDWLGDG